MDYGKESLKLHEKVKGKIGIKPKVPLKTKDDLSLAYTPGIAEPCLRIVQDKENVYKYTMKGNAVAVITDGSSILGLGNIGSEAGLPVLEGKALIFKVFADIDAFPIALASQDVDRTIETIRNIAPGFGGINLEDIKAPECFLIEESLQDLGIPVMHDDQHGTAIVVLAALINALKVVQKKFKNIKIVVNGAGAAGIAISNLLLHYGVDGHNILVCDSKGIICQGRNNISSKYKEQLALCTNLGKLCGNLADAVKNADVFIGVSRKDVLSKEMVASMADKSIVFALSNPDPEIMPADAKEAGATIVATGRSDFPNQVNNALVFPGIFRGALDCRATRITTPMKTIAAESLAGLIKNPTAEKLLPSILDKEVVPAIANAVKEACKRA